MDTLSFSSFESSGRAVLAFLHRRLGIDLRMIGQTEQQDRIGLQAKDHSHDPAPGTAFLRAYSSCSRKLGHQDAHAAPPREVVPACVAAPVERQIPINAGKGQLIVDEHELVELLGTMLNTLLQAELRIAQQARHCEKLQDDALTDPLTSLQNLRGWDRLLSLEEDRCQRYGHPAAVLIVDLDRLKHVNDTQGHAAGDRLIALTASALRKAARSLDVVGRLGGDEFGILSTQCDEAGGKALLSRVRAALAEANINASVGLAMRDPALGLRDACRIADRRMYEEKNRTKSARMAKPCCRDRAMNTAVSGSHRPGHGKPACIGQSR